MIEIKNVNFHYSGLDQAGLSDFNLSVTDGECILLCGASGCGKTTVTRLINGLIPHFFKGELTGDVYVNGLDIKQQELYNLAGIVGSVFQNPRSPRSIAFCRGRYGGLPHEADRPLASHHSCR